MNLHFNIRTDNEDLDIKSAEFVMPGGSVLKVSRGITERYCYDAGYVDVYFKDAFLESLDGFPIFETSDYGYVDLSDAASKMFARVPFKDVRLELEEWSKNTTSFATVAFVDVAESNENVFLRARDFEEDSEDRDV